MQYTPGLDGLRAVAIAMVLAFHARVPMAGGGLIGVDVFFVLSGFLITKLLSAELADTGRVAIMRFYGRRALRLYPTFLLLLAAFLAAAPLWWPTLPAWQYAAISGLYLTDYAVALFDVPLVLSYTWSLAVEEHFYLIWPLLLPAVMRARSPAKLLYAAFVMCTLWRIANVFLFGWSVTYFRFDTRLSGLVLGCLLATMPPIKLPAYAAPGSLFGLAVLTTVPAFGEPSALTLMATAAELFAAILVLSTTRGGPMTALLGSAWLSYLGRLSYGIYLWHYPTMYWLRDRFDWPVTLAIGSLSAVALAALSYHLIDRPLRQLRTGAATPRTTDVGVPGAPVRPRKPSIASPE